jgi:hypothetical protein
MGSTRQTPSRERGKHMAKRQSIYFWPIIATFQHFDPIDAIYWIYLNVEYLISANQRTFWRSISIAVSKDQNCGSEEKKRKKMNFKVNFSNGASIKLMKLPENITLNDLKKEICEKTTIPVEEQHIMGGFPPKPIQGEGVRITFFIIILDNYR